MGAAGGSWGAAAVEIGADRQLLVDEYLIERMSGEVELRLHSPVAREVSLVHDAPWEGNTCGYHTIFRDGDIVRMYYRGWDHDEKTGKQLHPAVVCYAESADGIVWVKPKLGLVAFGGSKDNNIILEGHGTHNFTPFKDGKADCPAAQRYKAVARGEDEGHQQLFAFVSGDGVRWRSMRDEPIVTDGAFDSQNLVFWDAARGQYWCYYRDFHDGVRDIKAATSKDFVNWSKGQWLDYGDAPREHLYTNQVQAYYRAPKLFVGFPTRYLPDRGSIVEGLFITSRDGLRFRRWGEAVIRPGANGDKWGNRCNYIWLGMVETASSLPGAPNEISIYSNEGYYEGRGAKTRRYTYRIDGFVSAHAKYAGGEVLTKPLVFLGEQLAVNISTSAAGSLAVEVQDADGTALPGFGLSDCKIIYGDDIERAVEWSGGSVGKLAGRAVRLRFVLRDADLYAFGFRDED